MLGLKFPGAVLARLDDAADTALGVFAIKESNALSTLCASTGGLVWAQLRYWTRYAVVTALVAQRIEHLTTDQKVGGSSPSERARLRQRRTSPDQHLLVGASFV